MSSTLSDGGLSPVARSALHEALGEAEERTLAEFDVVRSLLRGAVDAATAGDVEKAQQVVEAAAELERRYGDVHDRLVTLIARQAPVAGDLRLAIALLHVNDRIDRMGAQCVNIATLCRQVAQSTRPSSEQLECLAETARLTDEQIAEAQRVFSERDLEGARALRDHDAGINEGNRRCFALAVHDGDDESRRETAFFVAMMARALERIGDNAVDIGHQATFAATGRLRRKGDS